MNEHDATETAYRNGYKAGKLVELLTDNLPRCGNLPRCDNPLQLSCDEQVQRIVDHLIMNGVTVQEWVPVTKRLPDLELVDAKSDDFELYACLVTVKNFRAKSGRYVKKAWYDGVGFIDEDCIDITYDVTNWMPLPEPAEEV